MSAPAQDEDGLTNVLRRMLLPHPFPPRRDVELAGSVNDSSCETAAFDMFRTGGGHLVVTAVRVEGGGPSPALRAANLQRLARAMAEIEPTASTLLAGVRWADAQAFGEIALHMAAAVFDPAGGTLSLASEGEAMARLAGSGGNNSARLRPEAGDKVWIAAGCKEIEEPTDDNHPDPAEAVRAVLGALPGGTALVALRFRLEQRPTHRHEFVVSNDLAAIPAFSERLEALCLAAGVPDEVPPALALALDELLTNTISYGYGDGGAHEILLEVEFEPGAVLLTIRDDGRPFDPLTVPEPDLSLDLEERSLGGLGMHFVRTLLDEVHYRRDKGWNVLSLRKHFSMAKTPLPDL